MITAHFPNRITNRITKISSISKTVLAFLLLTLSIANTAQAIPADDALESPVYATWNSFLDQTNVIVLANKSSAPMIVFFTLYDRNGDHAFRYDDVEVPANGQRDIVLNRLRGFPEDDYGVVRIDFDQPGALDGHSVSYREGENGDYEFAITRQFKNSVHASSQAFFNTIQPSQNPDEASNAVISYAQISNIEDFAEGYTLEVYDEAGSLLSTSHVDIPAQGRRDIEVAPGAGKVGLLVARPDNFESRYLAQIVSYGSNQPVGMTPTAFNFAFSEEFQDVRDNFETIKYLNVSRGAGAKNWIAIANVFGSDVNLSIVDSNGNKVLDQDLSIGLRSQLHFDVNAVLGEGQSGIAVITPASGGSVIANSRAYYSDSSGRITDASLQEFGSFFAFGITTPVSFAAFQGNYNTFLGNLNWLRLFNVGESNSIVNVELLDQNGISLGNQDLVVGAGRGLDIELGSMLSFHVPENTYGLVRLSAPFGLLSRARPRASFNFEIVPQLLRLKPSSIDPSVVDLASPLQLRTASSFCVGSNLFVC